MLLDWLRESGIQVLACVSHSPRTYKVRGFWGFKYLFNKKRCATQLLFLL